MATKQFLQSAGLLTKFIIVFMAFGLLSIAFINIHSEFSPATYKSINVKKNGNFIKISFDRQKDISQTKAEYIDTFDNRLYLSKLTFKSKLLLFITPFVYSLLIIIAFIWLNKFINSAQNHLTFFSKSSRYLKYIAYTFIVILIVIPILKILTSLQNLKMVFSDGVISTNNNDMYLYVDTFFIYLILTFIALVFSQMLEEGERIKSENNLTI